MQGLSAVIMLCVASFGATSSTRGTEIAPCQSGFPSKSDRVLLQNKQPCKNSMATYPHNFKILKIMRFKPTLTRIREENYSDDMNFSVRTDYKHFNSKLTYETRNLKRVYKRKRRNVLNLYKHV